MRIRRIWSGVTVSVAASSIMAVAGLAVTISAVTISAMTALTAMTGHVRAEETGPAPGTLADICPTPDTRDTVDSVRATVAARLGAPVKEETVGTQYVLTFRQKDGSQLFVMLTRDGDKLEVNCYASKS